MKKYAKYILIFILSGTVSVSVYYWKNRTSDNQNILPNVCGENEDNTFVNNLSLNHIWEGRGDLSKTLNEEKDLAHYQDWRLPDNAKVRVIEERYSNWGMAHEALGKRIKMSKSVCQRGRKLGSSSFIDSDGTRTRVIAIFEDNSVEILTARECENEKCSFLEITQAPSLSHALAKEVAYNRIDY